MSEKQEVPNQVGKMLGQLVEHQTHFMVMPTADREWVIRNPQAAIGLFAEAVKNRNLVELPFDFIIRVDRSVKPSYPDWMKELVHPELELAGPAEYDLSQVELWIHKEQRQGSVQGKTIHEHLWKDGALISCLNRQDGLAIQQKGIAVFRKFFGGKKVFLWGSVVRSVDGLLNVPYLHDGGDRVMMGSTWVGNRLGSDCPAARFRK
jgi:hypothetical protein